jgi:poly [ADP-ribose] polymerase
MNQTSQLQALSSQFYTLIPTDFGNKIPPVINSFDLLHAKMRQIEALMDVQVTSTLMNDPLNVGMNPVDANYKKLGATYEIYPKHKHIYIYTTRHYLLN